MSDYALELITIQSLEQTGCYRNRCMFLIYPGSKRVGGFLLDDIDFRNLGQPRCDRHLLHNVKQLGVILFLYLTRARARKDYLLPAAHSGEQ